MPDEINIPGLEGIDLTTPEDTRPDWFSGDEMGEDDPAFQEIVAKMAEAGMAVPEKLPDPTPLPTGAEGEPQSDSDSDGASDEDPVPEPELPPVYDDGAPPHTDSDAPAEETYTPSALIDVEIDGQQYQINQEQAAYLLQMNSWIEQVPPAVKEQWAGIQDGTHVAITQEQLQQFQAAQQAAQQPTVSPNRVDPDTLDDDTAAYIRELEARSPAPMQQPSVDQGPSQAELQAAAQRQANERVRLNDIIVKTTASYAEEYGLNEEQVQHLQQVTSELAIVPNIQRRKQVYSPTGQLIRDADFGEVVREAYGVAMNSDAELQKIHSDHVYEVRKARETEANRTVAQKKGRAGSLASAPSAAVPAGNEAPKIGANNQMDVQSTANAIAAAIAEAAKTP